MKTALALVLLSAFAVTATVAQAQPAGPEQKKLDYFAKWRSEVNIMASAGSPAAKALGKEICEWFADAHVVCRNESTSPAGSYKSMRVISYVPAVK